MPRKNKISISIKGEEQVVVKPLEFIEPIEEELLKPGFIVSRLPHAVTLAYEGYAIVVPPFANANHKVRVANVSKLSHLIPGVSVILE